MPLADDITKVLDEYGKSLSEDAAFQELREFFEEMRKAGIAQRKEYDIPQMDTIGKSVFHNG